MSPRDIAPLLPYSYESVTLGVTCLEDVGLCQKIQNGQRSKVVHLSLIHIYRIMRNGIVLLEVYTINGIYNVLYDGNQRNNKVASVSYTHLFLME